MLERADGDGRRRALLSGGFLPLFNVLLFCASAGGGRSVGIPPARAVAFLEVVGAGRWLRTRGMLTPWRAAGTLALLVVGTGLMLGVALAVGMSAGGVCRDARCPVWATRGGGFPRL